MVKWRFDLRIYLSFIEDLSETSAAKRTTTVVIALFSDFARYWESPMVTDLIMISQ